MPVVHHVCITYDARMRTTVDLPPTTHRRARELAERRGVSLSAVVADLTARGLAQVDSATELAIDDLTGLPLVRVGREITMDDVADALDEQ